jgi:drug/metabolite transporter (DMT)-like permease
MADMYELQLRWRPVTILLVLAVIWGANMAVIKIGAQQLAPLFMAGLRSVVAAACLYVWMRAKGIALFPSRMVTLHGIVVGLLFGCEFGFIYVGLQHTLASRTYLLVYTAPFFAAAGAHFFLQGDRLNPLKTLGLVLAFCGVFCLFAREAASFSLSILAGDLMALTAGALWAATTLYLKRYLSYQAVPLQTLFYQVFFSAPLLFLLSAVVEDPMVSGFSFVTAFSVFYQCIIVAFLSYLVWFQLVHQYPVSLLHAFSFFTPVFGVFLSGLLILGEVITPNVVVALIFVSMGMVLVNRRPRP